MVSTHRNSGRFAFFAAVALAAVLAAACSQKSGDTAVKAPAGPLALATPLVDIMRASVEIPADGIWAAQAAEKLSDQEWLLADQDSVSLADAATLISMPATGKDDAARIAKPDWAPWVADIQKTALELRAAAKAKDKAKFAMLADHLTDTCQACHDKYRPTTPSDGVARYPFYPPRILDKSKPAVG